MTRKLDFKNRWQTLSFYMTLGLGVLATAFGAADFIVGIVGGWTLNSKIPSLLLFAVGLLITVSIIDRRIERQEYQERLKLDQDMFTKLGPGISTILGAADAGVGNIYAKRKWDTEAEASIRAHLEGESAQTISIAAIALPKFFHPREKYGNELRRLFKKGEIHWRILLLHPQSRAASQRAKRERGGDTIDNLKQSIRHIQGEIDKGVNIEARLYSFHPILFLLITENSMLVEPYHFGRIVRSPDASHESVSAEVGCNGGLVPLMQIRNLRKPDQAYAIFKDHFEYIWEEKSIPVYSAVTIAEPDSGGRYIVLENTHRHTLVKLAGWCLETACEGHTQGQVSMGKQWRKIYTFQQEDMMQSGDKLVLRDTIGTDSDGVRHIGRSIPDTLTQYMDTFWADEGRQVRLRNQRGRVVAKYPSDGYVKPDLFPLSFPGDDIY